MTLNTLKLLSKPCFFKVSYRRQGESQAYNREAGEFLVFHDPWPHGPYSLDLSELSLVLPGRQPGISLSVTNLSSFKSRPHDLLKLPSNFPRLHKEKNHESGLRASHLCRPNYTQVSKTMTVYLDQGLEASPPPPPLSRSSLALSPPAPPTTESDPFPESRRTLGPAVYVTLVPFCFLSDYEHSTNLRWGDYDVEKKLIETGRGASQSNQRKRGRDGGRKALIAARAPVPDTGEETSGPGRVCVCVCVCVCRQTRYNVIYMYK